MTRGLWKILSKTLYPTTGPTCPHSTSPATSSPTAPSLYKTPPLRFRPYIPIAGDSPAFPPSPETTACDDQRPRSRVMGNASAKEVGDGCNGAPPPTARSDGKAADHAVRVHSVDLMGTSPPESPGRSRSPLLFAPQVPVIPLQRAADVPAVHEQLWTNDAHNPSEGTTEKGIPTLITWSYGGNDVAVEGSWDNWSSRKSLQRTGKDHSILLVLPFGVYQYKLMVDGEWRYIPDLPCVTDEMGQITNLLDVNDYVPEILDGITEFECPPSPESSYGNSFPVDEDFAKEPPAVPPQLHVTVLGTHDSEEAPKKPQHVVLNHLFIEKGWASQSLVSLGQTHRFQSKYVTVVLYKALRRP